jgi:integrase
LLANATQAKIRNVTHAVFAHCRRYEWLMRNPISLVRRSATRTKTPDVLDAEELRKLLVELQNPARVVVFLTAATGLRISEALGLSWSDVDFRLKIIDLKCAVVHRQLGEMKTEASQKPVPMGGALAAALQEWSTQSVYRLADDWVFASPKMHGKQPHWPETLLKCYVQPAAKRLGITKQIGWHSFRRTFATLLKGSGEDVKTVQELMRHANSKLTLDVYAQALTPAKRAAHLKVVEMIRPVVEPLVVLLCSHTQEVSVYK